MPERVNSLNRLQTSRLLLRGITESHRDDFLRLHLDPRVVAMMSGEVRREQTIAWFDTQVDHWQKWQFGLWIAFDRLSGDLVGSGGLHNLDFEGHQEIELDYCIHPDFWGRGLGTELANQSVQVGFETLRLSKIICFTRHSNIASQRVMQKVGFCHERDTIFQGVSLRLCSINPEQFGGRQV